MLHLKIICRCEEVTEEEIIRALEEGAETANEVKRFTRAGMGLCQGRTCRCLIEKIICKKTGAEPKNAVPASYRQPVRPVLIQDMTCIYSAENNEKLE